MPKPCRLCSHSKSEAIDKFIADGTHSYKDFQAAFPELATIHVSAWSRHRKDHITATASEKEAQEFCSALSVKSLKKLNRSLLSCAKRAHAKGKTGDEITAYRQIAENQKQIRELEQGGENEMAPPVINVHFRDPAEVELSRAEARAKIRALEPKNAVITEAEQAASGIVSQPAAQADQAESTERGNRFEVWEAMGRNGGILN
ncbi:MAG TPA: hypothetical protein VJP02_04605 [Candidatus Sulfotelmatobacter sp.]|nr:hypothetical protein [Candidatus Sulfotelmatobacter sp.]